MFLGVLADGSRRRLPDGAHESRLLRKAALSFSEGAGREGVLRPVKLARSHQTSAEERIRLSFVCLQNSGRGRGGIMAGVWGSI